MSETLTLPLTDADQDAAPEAAPCWEVTSVNVVEIPNRGPVELSISLRLDREHATPLLAAAAAREAELRREVADALAASEEAQALRDAVARVAELTARQKTLEADLAEIGEQLTAMPSVAAVRKLSTKESTAKNELDGIRRALAPAHQEAQRRRDDLTRAGTRLAHARVALEHQEIQRVRDEAGGLPVTAAAELDRLIVMIGVENAIISYQWSGLVTAAAVARLFPESPNLLPAPPAA
jgi:hypothetical protein